MSNLFSMMIPISWKKWRYCIQNRYGCCPSTFNRKCCYCDI